MIFFLSFSPNSPFLLQMDEIFQYALQDVESRKTSMVKNIDKLLVELINTKMIHLSTTPKHLGAVQDFSGVSIDYKSRIHRYFKTIIGAVYKMYKIKLDYQIVEHDEVIKLVNLTVSLSYKIDPFIRDSPSPNIDGYDFSGWFSGMMVKFGFNCRSDSDTSCQIFGEWMLINAFENLELKKCFQMVIHLPTLDVVYFCSGLLTLEYTTIKSVDGEFIGFVDDKFMRIVGNDVFLYELPCTRYFVKILKDSINICDGVAGIVAEYLHGEVTNKFVIHGRATMFGENWKNNPPFCNEEFIKIYNEQVKGMLKRYIDGKYKTKGCLIS